MTVLPHRPPPLTPGLTLNELRDIIHSLARSKGWYDGGERNIPEMLALIHSEVSEALEEYRVWDGSDHNNIKLQDGKPVGFASEVADIVIRCLDLCGYLGIDIDRVVFLKHEFNTTRPIRHGGKRA